jgi:uncharacterized OB-fold protein
VKCLQCQHENRPPAKFCEECAAALTSRHDPLGGRTEVTALVAPRTQDMRLPFRDVLRRSAQTAGARA